jgi:hypothetical protein
MEGLTMRYFGMLLCVFLLVPSLSWGIAPCRKVKTNLKGSPAGTTITISSSAVIVADANTSRCALTIHNTSANAVLCRSAGDGTPTATVGKTIAGGASVSLGTEGQEQWQCIRASSDATVDVMEGYP